MDGLWTWDEWADDWRAEKKTLQNHMSDALKSKDEILKKVWRDTGPIHDIPGGPRFSVAKIATLKRYLEVRDEIRREAKIAKRLAEEAQHDVPAWPS